MSDKKSAFTLVEMLAVIVIAGIIISAAAVTYNRVWQNSRIDSCESELRSMASGFESLMIDYGKLTINNDLNYENKLSETLELLNRQYLPYVLESEEIAADKKSVKLMTKIKTDPWNTKYTVRIYTYEGDDAASVPGLIIISSCGADKADNSAGYKNDNYGDDIVAVVEPK